MESFVSNVRGLSKLVLLEISRLGSAEAIKILENIRDRCKLEIQFLEVEHAIALLRSRGTIRPDPLSGQYRLGNALIRNCLKEIGNTFLHEQEAVKQYTEYYYSIPRYY